MSLLSKQERSDIWIDSMKKDLLILKELDSEYNKGRALILEGFIPLFSEFGLKAGFVFLKSSNSLSSMRNYELAKGCSYQIDLLIQSLYIYFPELKEDASTTH